MGWLSKLFSVGGGESPISAVGNALDKLFTSDEERAQAAAVMEKLQQQPHILQAEINKLEAQHRSIFVAGWRPWIGWVCGSSFAYVWICRPVIADIAALFGKHPEFVAIDTASMMQLVIALLGLGGLRTFEKFGGKAK